MDEEETLEELKLLPPTKENINEWIKIVDGWVERAARPLSILRQAALEHCAALLDAQHDYTAAAQQVRALMFIARFAQDIAQRQDQLGQ